MIVITVSTNYADILEIILPQNSKFFDKWIIVTSPDDADTLRVIEASGCKNIEVLFFDFKKGGTKFNKGGAIKMCQQLLESRRYSGDVLILDSDIFLPNDFADKYSKLTINENTLYTPKLRHDFYSYKNFCDGRVDKVYHRSHLHDGFFHLYKHTNRFLYKDSVSANKCDDEFVELFRAKNKINDLTVCHLGRDGVNWDGRKACDFKR